MFSVDSSLSRLFRSSSRLAGIALALTLTAGFSGVSDLEANASSKSWHKSGNHYSVSSRHTGSRHRTRRHFGHNKYRGQRRQYGNYRQNNYPRHLFIGRSLKDFRSSGVSLGHRHYRVSTHNYGRTGLVISNQNGVRVISNYGRSYNSRYNPGPTINGVSINNKCPLNFQCGLRAYDDNSGPRIISLGKGAHTSVGDPSIEKIGPPKVITYTDGVN